MTHKEMLDQLRTITEQLTAMQSELNNNDESHIGNILDDCFKPFRKARMELAKAIRQDNNSFI